MSPTATKAPATTSTPRLSEVARHLVVPDGIETSVFPRVERRLATVGYGFDRWQQGLGSVALGCRADGMYAATIGGVVVSIPRQVGKTYTVGGLVVGLCLEFPGLRVAWTSHHNRTNTNTFRSLQSIVKKPKLRASVASIREANGEQEIRFANGSIIFFGARAQGFGRGMEEMDILVLDEAQILDLKALEDMVPSTNQAKHPHGALIFFIGTPPRPSDPGEAFKSKRAAALSGVTTDQVYVEFSADPDASLDDRSQWPTMNPSYPIRTPLASMLRMRENIPDDDSWSREAMGRWDDDIEGPQWKTITRSDWIGCGVAMEPDQAGFLTGPITLAIEMDAGSRLTHLIAAGAHGEVVGVDLHATFPNPREVVPYLIQLKDAAEIRVVLDKRGPASSLLNELTEAGIEVEEIDTPTLMRGTGAFIDAATDQQVRHRHREALDESIGRATLRKYGESRLINRAGDGDPSVAIGAVLAHLAHVAASKPPSFAWIIGGS